MQEIYLTTEKKLLIPTKKELEALSKEEETKLFNDLHKEVHKLLKVSNNYANIKHLIAYFKADFIREWEENHEAFDENPSIYEWAFKTIRDQVYEVLSILYDQKPLTKEEKESIFDSINYYLDYYSNQTKTILKNFDSFVETYSIKNIKVCLFTIIWEIIHLNIK